MFFSRSRNSPAAQSMLGAASPRPALENAMTGAIAPDDKINAIGELIDMKVDAPTQVDFSDQVSVCVCVLTKVVLWNLTDIVMFRKLPKRSSHHEIR